MQFEYRYLGDSQIHNDAARTEMTLIPDSLRAPTYFKGRLSRKLPFREAISALHEVVESDMRYKPRDLSDYRAWLASQEAVWLAEAAAIRKSRKERMEELRHRLEELQTNEAKILAPFYAARQRYFKYLYTADIDAWFVLDPVITVHPDSVFFECFSQDESSYARLSCGYEVFDQLGDKACGTTNVDYSHALYQEFQKIRGYKDTELNIDPSGFAVETTGSDSFKEEKIDLPESWVRGFLQVGSAMTLPTIELDLHPMDLYNLLLWLRRHREKGGPRSLRFGLTPGQPIEIIIAPWQQKLRCPRSLYMGSQSHEVRIWGRRRLFVFERLLPVARRFKVRLLGSGLPSFWTAELEGMKFTLGLSGWSASDFSRMGHFDLMAPRGEVDSLTAGRIFAALSRHWVAPADALARELGLDIATVKAGLGIYAQAGRVLYDLDSGAYRLRELSREPLPMEQLRFANEREAQAGRLLKAGLVDARMQSDNALGLTISGEVTDGGKAYHPEIRIDPDQRLAAGQCDCFFYHQHRLNQGPCQHMLAIRLRLTSVTKS